MKVKFLVKIKGFFNKDEIKELTKRHLSQEEWNKIEKEFLIQLNTYFLEIMDSIITLRNATKGPFIRSQLCLAFIATDTFSRFYAIFKGEREELNINNEKRFKNWLNAFVFTEKNEVYRSKKNKIKCDVGVVWHLRNSFLHFYSFPNLKNKIGFVFNFSDDRHKKIEEGLKKDGYKITFIDVYFLIEAILKGFLLQLQDIIEMLKNSPNQYIDTVLFAHNIIMKENATTIDLKNKI